MEDQQKFNQLLNEINVYKQQGDLIQQQIELVRASIAEVDALTNTLDDLEGKDSVEAFVPVGAGSFIKGELKNTFICSGRTVSCCCSRKHVSYRIKLDITSFFFTFFI